MFLPRYTGSGVLHEEIHIVPPNLVPEMDVPACREFQGIIQEITYNLTQTVFIHEQTILSRVFTDEFHLDALVYLHLVQGFNPRQKQIHVHFLGNEIQYPGFDFREIENIVYQLQ